jgi:hypothetical protein
MLALLLRADKVRGMAVKQIVLSDLSSEELTDDTHTTVIVSHPDFNSSLELDISRDEAAKLVNTTLRLVTFEIHEPNKPVRTAQVETKTLDKLFEGVDFDVVLQGARKATTRETTKRASAPKGEKRDYTSVEWAGSVKRGKISDGEKATVKAHLAEVNKNLAARGERQIDPTNPEHKEKYGL